MSEPTNNHKPVRKDKSDTDEPQAYKDDGGKKSTCGDCMMTFPTTAILVIDKQARCPACGAWLIELRP